ncbi:MAG: phosphatase PAP2 family protein [Woeseiaceae bacterium]|nr:phosphatase PAP2 family protein [Woeseiaceae bacterium]
MTKHGLNRNTIFFALLAMGLVGTARAQSDDEALAEAGDWVQILLPAGGYVGAWITGDKQGAIQLTKALGAAGVSAHFFKQVAERGRPDATDSRSFPSGHTTAAFAGSEFIRIRYGNAWGIPATVAAAFVGYTRIRANKHFRDDVLAGASNGLMWNWYFTSPYADSMAIRPTAYDDGYGFDIHYEFGGERLPNPDDGRSARFRYTLEWGPVSQDTNLFRSPLNGGFPIDLATAETEFDFTSRVSFDYFADRHEWSGYLAPMELIEFDTASVLTEPAQFAGTVFEPIPDSDFEARYNFIEARAVYRYRLHESDRSTVRIGGGASYQQSLLGITQFFGTPRNKTVIDSATADIKEVKAIASLRMQHRFTRRIEVEFQVDGFPGSDHYLNTALLLNWRAAPGWSMGIGARYIDREVSSDDVYNKLQVGDLVLTVSHDFS